MSLEAVRTIIETSPELENKPLSDDDELKRLAKMAHLQYGRERKAAAEKLGINVGELDQAVKLARTENIGMTGQGRPVELDDVQPWPQAGSWRDALGRHIEDAAQLCCDV